MILKNINTLVYLETSLVPYVFRILFEENTQIQIHRMFIGTRYVRLDERAGLE